MSQSEPFETTVQKTNAWLAEIMRGMRWNDRHRAWIALRAVLHALRDRLSVDEAIALGAQLPLLVRGGYYEGYHRHGKPVHMRTKEEFFDRVRLELHGSDDFDIEELTNVVLDVVSDHVSADEAQHLARILPKEIRTLWPIA